MRHGFVVVLVCALVVTFLLVPMYAAAEGSETGVFPDRVFQITRSPPGGPRGDAYRTPIVPDANGVWSVLAVSIAGSVVVVEVWHDDAGIPSLVGSSMLRAAGETSSPVVLHRGFTYAAVFTPYGRPGTSVLSERFVEVQPWACFTYSPAEPFIGDVVTFDASCSSAGDGALVEYAWDFGDGSTAVGGPLASHLYPTVGTYAVTLRVTNEAGISASTTQVITILAGA